MSPFLRTRQHLTIPSPPSRLSHSVVLSITRRKSPFQPQQPLQTELQLQHQQLKLQTVNRRLASIPTGRGFKSRLNSPNLVLHDSFWFGISFYGIITSISHWREAEFLKMPVLGGFIPPSSAIHPHLHLTLAFPAGAQTSSCSSGKSEQASSSSKRRALHRVGGLSYLPQDLRIPSSPPASQNLFLSIFFRSQSAYELSIHPVEDVQGGLKSNSR